MVGATQPPPQQTQQQQQNPQALTVTTATAKTSAEEEALKRNTDCVYFLASPLTCKKGTECEYRHSDNARLNPRDCWYWLNGSCLNPKCAFRHPPLDGLLGTQVSTPVGSSQPSTLTIPLPVTSAPYNAGKQGVPCIFFQQGFCLKGDRCPFFHAPASTVINKKLVPPRTAITNTAEPPSLKKPFGSLEKCSQEPKFPQANVPKSADSISQGTLQAKVEEAAPIKNGVTFNRYSAPSPVVNEGPPRYNRPTDINPPDTNGDSMSRSHHVQQVLVSDDHDVLNGREAGEFSREPSPGFDVLVDDELGESDYYHNEDHHYGRSGSHDYDIDRSADYDATVDVDRDAYRDLRRYDSYEQMQGLYGREKHRASPEIGVGSAHVERSRYPKGDSPDRIADLRHHLSKQRRANGLRSVISHDYARDNHSEDRNHRGSSRRDAHRLITPKESSVVSYRLRGRIKLPGRSSSPVNGSDLRPEREMDRGRNREPLVSSIHHGRLRDRIKGRVQEEISNEGRSSRGPRMREAVNDNNANFAGPKSLAELKKGGKIAENKDQHMNNNDRLSLALGKRKYPTLEIQQQSESDVLFEGPKPLSEILKKKKVTETMVPGNSLISRNKEDNNHKEEEERSLAINREEAKSANVSELETEEGMIVEEPAEDHEPEAFDQRDGESDYEQIDGEDYTLDEAENAEGEEEYFDDDDGDDFAKKIGVMFS
ncbi:hypothetical protein C3L33_23138, partial [Rhododendron williamsianum]